MTENIKAFMNKMRCNESVANVCYDAVKGVVRVDFKLGDYGLFQVKDINKLPVEEWM